MTNLTNAELLAEIERLDALIGDAPDSAALSLFAVKAKASFFVLMLANRAQIKSVLRGVEAAREFVDPITTGLYRGASNFAIADIEGFREQQQAAKVLLAALSEVKPE